MSVPKTRKYFAFINISLCAKKVFFNLVLIVVIIHQHQQLGKLGCSHQMLTTSPLFQMTSLPRLCSKTVAKLLVRVN